MSEGVGEARDAPPDLADLETRPIGEIGRWRWLWEGDQRFPARSHRRFLGPLIRTWKRLLRPLVEAPQRDLWERQRLFNLALLSELAGQDQRLQKLDEKISETLRTLYEVSARADSRQSETAAVLAAHEQAFLQRDQQAAVDQQRLAAHEQQFERVDEQAKQFAGDLDRRTDELLRQFARIDDVFREHDRRADALIGQFAKVDAVFREHSGRADVLERQFDHVDEVFKGQDLRVGHLEKFMGQGIREVMRHDDALFALVDQKLDRAQRESRELVGLLRGALARVEVAAERPAGVSAPGADSTASELAQALAEAGYLELERRHRGTEPEIAERLAVYLPRLSGRLDVLDLGCGRGEALRLLTAHGHRARGVDASAEMVAHCRRQGLAAEQADLFAALSSLPPASVDAVVSFHVVEHLPAAALAQLVSLAFRALRAGGLLILETPNPLSLVVAARNFWLDPTHQRPIHPESLRLSCESAGFDRVETLWLRPFPQHERLPEIEIGDLGETQHLLADRVNRLRDQLDDLLFGYQDYAVLAERD